MISCPDSRYPNSRYPDSRPADLRHPDDTRGTLQTRAYFAAVDGVAEPTNLVAFPCRSIPLLHSNRLLLGLRSRLCVYVLTRGFRAARLWSQDSVVGKTRRVKHASPCFLSISRMCPFLFQQIVSYCTQRRCTFAALSPFEVWLYIYVQISLVNDVLLH